MSAPAPAPSHYDVLQLRSDACADEIRAAWRRLVRQHHPDHGGPADTDTLSRINKAYEVLSSPHMRAQHDLDLRSDRPLAHRRRALPTKALWLAGGLAAVVFGALAGVLLQRAAPPAIAPAIASGTVQEAEPPLVLVPARHLESLVPQSASQALNRR